MRLNTKQLEDFERDGFLIFPGLLTQDEVNALRCESDRLATIEADYIKRERNGALRTIFRVHEDDGPTRSAAFRALSRTPRLLGTAMQRPVPNPRDDFVASRNHAPIRLGEDSDVLACARQTTKDVAESATA